MNADPADPLSQDGPVVVGFDDHVSSRRALAYAVRLAERLDVPLRVLHVIGLEDFPVDPDSASWDEAMQRHEDELTEHVRGLVDLPAQQWSCRIVRGDAWHALVTEGDDQDALMIVVGQRTHAHLIAGALARVLSGTTHAGTVGTHLIRRGHRPVLIVPSVEED